MKHFFKILPLFLSIFLSSYINAGPANTIEAASPCQEPTSWRESFQKTVPFIAGMVIADLFIYKKIQKSTIIGSTLLGLSEALWIRYKNKTSKYVSEKTITDLTLGACIGFLAATCKWSPLVK
mgnify:CR=1 FL=1